MCQTRFQGLTTSLMRIEDGLVLQRGDVRRRAGISLCRMTKWLNQSDKVARVCLSLGHDLGHGPTYVNQLSYCVIAVTLWPVCDSAHCLSEEVLCCHPHKLKHRWHQAADVAQHSCLFSTEGYCMSVDSATSTRKYLFKRCMSIFLFIVNVWAFLLYLKWQRKYIIHIVFWPTAC